MYDPSFHIHGNSNNQPREPKDFHLFMVMKTKSNNFQEKWVLFAKNPITVFS